MEKGLSRRAAALASSGCSAKLEAVGRLQEFTRPQLTMESSLDERLTFLEDSRDSHFNISGVATRAPVRMDTLLALMVLKRSLSLVFGFASMIRSRNFICAVPLIRMQLDNLLRFRAAFIAPDINEFVTSVIEGREVRNLEDARGRRMTDRCLQDAFKADYPWLETLYKATSGYVHLSDMHFANTVRPKPGGEWGELQIYVGPDDQMISPQAYSAATENMILVTYELLKFMADWAEAASQTPPSGSRPTTRCS